MATDAATPALETPELLLRFCCPGCRQRLTVPLEKLGSVPGRCPKCQAELTIPEVNDHVRGFGAVRPAPVETSPAPIEQQHVPDADKNRESREAWKGLKRFVGGAIGGLATLDLMLPLRGLKIRNQARIAFFALWLGPYIILATLASIYFKLTGADPPGSDLLAPAVMVYTLFGWWPLRRFVMPLLNPTLIPTFRCRGCKEVYEAVGRWTCSCGFTDYRERHVLNFRCPKCERQLGYTECQRCNATIILG